MCRGRRCGAALLILAVILLAACSRSIPPTALPTGEVSSTEPSPPSIPGLFTPASSCPPSGSISVSLATPQPADVLLELAWEGGLTRPELAFVFGRTPEFSLLPDGNVYYVDAPDEGEAQTTVAHLPPAERQELVQRVLDLGIDRLESYTDPCEPQADGSCLCVADAGESVVRVRLPGGELREIRNYTRLPTNQRCSRPSAPCSRTTGILRRRPTSRTRQPCLSDLCPHRPMCLSGTGHCIQPGSLAAHRTIRARGRCPEMTSRRCWP